MIFLKRNIKATSIVEAIVILLIIVSGTLGMYKVFISSQKLSNSTANKIQAIQIAREGIEAMKNIRDTNWIKFSADNKNCWNVWNYNNQCVGKGSIIYDIGKGSYKIFNKDKKWYMKSYYKNNDDFLSEIYRNNFEVFKNKNGFYTQTGTLNTDKFKIIPLFTREIKIEYPEDTNGDGNTDSNDEKMKVTSLVQWKDSASDKPHKVEFTSILTNWKK